MCVRFGRGLQSGGQDHQLGHEVRPLGDAEERAPRAAVARPAGEEDPQPDAARQLPPLPHDGDQSKGRRGSQYRGCIKP